MRPLFYHFINVKNFFKILLLPLTQIPTIFSNIITIPVFCEIWYLINMIKSAEATGDLPSTLDDLVYYYDSIDKTRKDLNTKIREEHQQFKEGREQKLKENEE